MNLGGGKFGATVAITVPCCTLWELKLWNEAQLAAAAGNMHFFFNEKHVAVFPFPTVKFCMRWKITHHVTSRPQSINIYKMKHRYNRFFHRFCFCTYYWTCAFVCSTMHLEGKNTLFCLFCKLSSYSSVLYEYFHLITILYTGVILA